MTDSFKTLFDQARKTHAYQVEKEELAKEAGIRDAASARAELVAHARKLAKAFAIQCVASREITIDDVQILVGDADLGPAAGAVFRNGEWEFSGRWMKSARKGNHHRMIRVWRLK